MVQLDTDPFLNDLNKLFERNKESGSVTCTMKRSNMVSKKHKKYKEAGDFSCLLRATDGKKKLSTTVGAKDHGKFQMSYATILKAHTGALKRREKVKAAKKPVG